MQPAPFIRWHRGGFRLLWRWTMQQLREAIPADHTYRFLMHDRDAIFSRDPEQRVRHLGVRGLKTPPQIPQANVLCERLLGMLRREWLDFQIPLTENHLQNLRHDRVFHDNTSRPHMALGPGIAQPPPHLPAMLQVQRRQLPEHLRVEVRQSWAVCTMSTSLDRKPLESSGRRVRSM